jgi:hypothetical protein
MGWLRFNLVETLMAGGIRSSKLGSLPRGNGIFMHLMVMKRRGRESVLKRFRIGSLRDGMRGTQLN